MKKLLALFGGFTVVAGGAATVVSCKKPESDQQKVDNIAKKLNEVFKKDITINVTSDSNITLVKGEAVPDPVKDAIGRAYDGDFKALLGDASLISEAAKVIAPGDSNYKLSLKVKLNKATSTDAINKISIKVENSQTAANRILGVIDGKLDKTKPVFVASTSNINLTVDQEITSGSVFDAIKASYKGDLNKDLEGAVLVVSTAVAIDETPKPIVLKVKLNTFTTTNTISGLNIRRAAEDVVKAEYAVRKLQAKFSTAKTLLIKNSGDITLPQNSVIANEDVIKAIKNAYGDDFDKDLNGGKLYLNSAQVVLQKDSTTATEVNLKVKVGDNGVSDSSLTTLSLWVLDSKYNAEKALQNLQNKFPNPIEIKIGALGSDLTIHADTDLSSESAVFNAIKNAYGKGFEADMLDQKLYAKADVTIPADGTVTAIRIYVGSESIKSKGELDTISLKAVVA